MMHTVKVLSEAFDYIANDNKDQMLINRVDAALQRVKEAVEFLEDHEDIVDGEFGPLPNFAMQVLQILRGPEL